MNKYKKPEVHFVRNSGRLSGDEIVKLSDPEFAKYLNRYGFDDEKKKYRIKSGYMLREIAGEYAIVPVDAECLITNAVMSPNDTAVFLWKAFEQDSTIQDVVIKGMQEFDVEENVIRKSVEHFVTDSLKYRILEEVE